MSKSKVVLVVDVTSATLDEAISVMCQDILQRMYNTPENSIALVLAGTPGTDVSQVSGNVDSFDNITVARPLRIADKTLVNLIKELPSYKDCGKKISLVPALELAVRLFHQEASKTHHMSENRIMLFTDECGIFDGNIESLAVEMNALKPQIVFKLIGPTLYDEETESQDWVESLPRNCQTMAKFCNKVEQGESICTEDAVLITRLYKTKKVRQASVFKGCLEVGSGTKLPVFLTTKILSAPHQQSLKMCDSTGGVAIRDRVYHLSDEKQTQIDPDSMNKGYRYGKSYIPISKVDASLMQGETEKGLVLICTTKRSNIRKEEFCTKSAFSVTAPTGDTAACAGLAAFATALRDLDMVAICRYVKKEDVGAKLCCLVPNVKSYCAVLMMVEMPFADQIKKAEFPRIKAEVTQDQLTAVDKLIDSMDLSTAPDFKVSEIANPDIQRRYECVTHKLLSSNDNSVSQCPTVDMSHFFKPPKYDSEDALKACNKVFNVSKVEEKIKKRTAGDMFNIDNVDFKNELKKIKIDDICFDDLLGMEVKIGTTTPLQDFKVAQSKLGHSAACAMMCDVITRLVQHGGDHVMNCLRSLRESCVKHEGFQMFNEFLKEAVNNPGVKKICQENKLSLIHRGECSLSPVLEGESEVFLYIDEISASLEDDDDDDLLDDL